MNDNLKTPESIAAIAGAASLGAMNVDLRHKVNVNQIQNIKPTNRNIRKYIKRGDVLVGSPTSADEAVSDFVADFKKYYNKARKQKKGVIPALKTGVNNAYIAGATSKMFHPSASHAELVIGKNRISYMGGGIDKIKGIQKDVQKRRGDIHYTIMRPEKLDKKMLSKLTKQIKKKGLADFERYDLKKAVTAAATDWITPKLNIKERNKSLKRLNKERAITKGYCSTLGALASRKTIGGKTADNILPLDYLRSKDWKAIGHLGKAPKNIKTKLINKIILKSPKMLVQGGAALAVAGIARHIAKSTQGLQKESEFVAFPI